VSSSGFSRETEREFKVKFSARLAFCTAALLGLAACATSQAPGAATPAGALDKTLQAFHWDLEKATDGGGLPLEAFSSAPPDKRVRLNFVGDARPGAPLLVVERLCNHISAGYTLDGDKLTVSRAVSTAMACANPALMQLEQSVATKLSGVHRVQLADGGQPPRLVLQLASGDRWYLSGTPTAATQYGSAGETMFLEVGPELKPCSHGVMKDAQCMQVREVKYDKAGVKTTTGEWSAFYGMIEGFTHQPGVRNVLRVKRYTLAQPPADASRFVYQLHLRVETETVRSR
jgi:hypothetical protein